MKVLIFGGNGMLGHKVYQACRDRFDTWIKVRRDVSSYGIFDPTKVVNNRGVSAVEEVKPDVVINCLGIVKQRSYASAEDMYYFNALLPHKLAIACAPHGIRLIQISTDCVFSGKQGAYKEIDLPDPIDVYGWSKLLGEVSSPGCLTLRTSFVGRELSSSRGLLEWLISNRGGQVQGFTHALFSGMTSIALAAIVADIVEYNRLLSGIYHVGAQTISKYDLLKLLNGAYDLGIDVLSDASSPVIVNDRTHCDRSLESICFRTVTGFTAPLWPEMLQELQHDPTPYDDWR